MNDSPGVAVHAGSSWGRGDLVWSCAVSGTALAIYVATLAPGLIAITDTPKFQFVGRVLGTAHPPGYPLYVMVSHLFGYLPVGSLAYRINLMSAVFMAGTLAVMYRCARQLGTDRLIAAVIMLAAATGSAVWYVSTIAEVYTLNAFLVAAALSMLWSWQQSRRPAAFFAGVACVALALGNHTTAAFLIPAVAVFACIVAPRFALKPSTIASSALIVIAGLSQYLFILVRTRQGAWGDAPASNLSELARVLSGAEYFDNLMPGGVWPFLTAKLPLILQTWLHEMSIAGAVLAGLGVVALWIRSKPHLILLGAGLLPYVAFTSAYTPGNFEVFLVPAFVMSWLLAAAGAQLAVDRTSSRLNRPSGAVLAGVLALLPVWQWTRNYDTRDLSHDRADMRFFDALFERLPDRAALLHEDFLVDRMVYYKTLGEYAGRSRDLLALVPSQLEPVARASRDRREVFAFPAAATLMRLMDGAEFSYSPFEVSGGSLARYLDDLPHGTMVAVGVPAKHLGRFMTANGALPLEAIGFRRALGGLVMNVAVIGTAGGHDGAGSVDRIAAQIRRDAPPAASGPRIASIEVHADLESAAIVYGGREIIRTTTGVAVATWRSGRLTAAFSIPASTGVPPLLLPGTAVYQLLEIRQRQSIGPEPLDLTAETSTGSFVYTTGSGGLSRFVLYVGSTRPLSPALLECSAPQWPALDVDEFAGEGRAEPLALALQGDGLPVDQRLLALPHVYRIAVVADWAGAIGVRVGLGGVPGVAYGRQSTGASGFIYGVNLATHLARIDERLLALQMANNHHSHLIGAGWSSVQADGIGPYRETLARDAGLLIPLEAARSIRVGVQLLSLAGVSPATVDLRFGERQVGMPVAVTPAWRRYWWDVPAEYVRSGVNEMFVSISPDAGRIAVSDVLIERMD